MATAITRLYRLRWRAYLQNAVIQAKFGEDILVEGYSELKAFHMAGKRIPVDNKVAMLVPYRGYKTALDTFLLMMCLKTKCP